MKVYIYYSFTENLDKVTETINYLVMNPIVSEIYLHAVPEDEAQILMERINNHGRMGKNSNIGIRITTV